MKEQSDEAKIKIILKENGLIKPSDEFSEHLTKTIIEHYRKRPAEDFRAAWLARIITGLAVAWCVIILYFTNIFVVQPALSISLCAFILGLWGLIGLSRKIMTAKINSV